MCSVIDTNQLRKFLIGKIFFFGVIMIVKNFLSKAERELCIRTRNEFKEELKNTPEFDADLNRSKRHIELKALIWLCNKFLG
jgi:hypothetical protein